MQSYENIIPIIGYIKINEKASHTINSLFLFFNLNCWILNIEGGEGFRYLKQKIILVLMVQYAEAKTARQLIQNVVSPLLSHIKDSFLLRKPFLTWRKSGFHMYIAESHYFCLKIFFFYLMNLTFSLKFVF